MLSGCSYFSPTQTDVSYDSGAGATAQIGDVKLSDVLIVSSAKGAPGMMRGMATNNGSQPIELAVSASGATVRVSVPGRTAVRLDGETSGDSGTRVTPVRFAQTAAAPGAKTTVTFASGSSGAVPVTVPVLAPQEPFGTATYSDAGD